MTYLTKNVYDVIKQRSLFGFEERKKEVNYMDAKVFGKFIMERRKQLGMTQAELAEKINVTDKAVSRWERGPGFPDINTLEPLADALGIEVVELMRSEINTERRETAVDRKNVVEIMKSTAEISEYHAAKKMKWLISGISFVMAVLGVMVTQSTKVFSSIAFYGCIIGCTTCVVLLRQYWEIREKREFYFSLIWCLGAASLIWMFQLFSIKAINSIMDVGSILIGSVIDFIFLKDFIESVIKKKYLQMAVCGIFLLSTTVEYFRIVLK